MAVAAGSWQLCTPPPWTVEAPTTLRNEPLICADPSAASLPDLQPHKLLADMGSCSSGSCEITADFEDDFASAPEQPSCAHIGSNRSLSVASCSSDTSYTELCSRSTPSTSLPDTSCHSSQDLATFLHQMSLPSSRLAFFCKGIHLSAQLCWELADFIAYSPTMRMLTLANCRLTDDLLEILLPALASSSSIITVDLPSNLLTDRGAMMLADLATKPNSSVSELQLSGNRIGDEGAATLAGALASSRKLATLNLAANSITDVGCRALAGAVATGGRASTNSVQVAPGNNISSAAQAELKRSMSGGGKRVLRLLSSLRG